MARNERSKSGTKPVVEQQSANAPAVNEDVDGFLAQLKATPVPAQSGNGKLVFAMDATMSRQPSWDAALQTQAEMFREAGRIGGLDVQLIYFRGFGECRASKWVSDADGLARLMTTVDCRGGNTQIEKVLKHVRKEAQSGRVNAVVYVGDCMEENIDLLCQQAGEIGLLGVRMFMFQEGNDAIALNAFREIARLTGGAYSRFDSGSADHLRELLSAVAVYAAGGRQALENFSGARGKGPRGLLEQLN
ncbi:VWA domain-containing protein [Anderseniella sp. Alg231-50]|uniref:VWA domain-containing protein n=1 Tax=Anderseniella sp. Alg231-50 TaxID=1922226 RepID=UPI003FCD446A